MTLSQTCCRQKQREGRHADFRHIRPFLADADRQQQALSVVADANERTGADTHTLEKGHRCHIVDFHSIYRYINGVNEL